MSLIVVVFIIGSIVVVGGVVGLAVVLIVNSNKRSKERAAGLTQYAHERGWRFTPSLERLGVAFQGHPFAGAFRPEYRSVVEGTYGDWPFIAFDFSVEDRRHDMDDPRSRTNYAIVAMHLGANVPFLELQSQNSIGSFFERLFGTEITIGNPELDNRYYINRDSQQFTRELLTPRMCSLLLQLQDRGWRFEGQSLLTFSRDHLSPALVEDRLASMRAVLSEVPPPVWERIHAR